MSSAPPPKDRPYDPDQEWTRTSRAPKKADRGGGKDGQPPAEKKRGPIKRYAVWLLGRQEYSAADLERRFTLKGYPAHEIQECLRFLQEHALQSDARFAGHRAQAKSVRQGNRRIQMDLKTKGIDASLIGSAVDALGSEGDRAINVVRKFLGKPLTQDLKAKIWRFLASRGFGSRSIQVAMASLQTALSATAEAAEHDRDEPDLDVAFEGFD